MVSLVFLQGFYTFVFWGATIDYNSTSSAPIQMRFVAIESAKTYFLIGAKFIEIGAALLKLNCFLNDRKKNIRAAPVYRYRVHRKTKKLALKKYLAIIYYTPIFYYYGIWAFLRENLDFLREFMEL